MNKLTGRSDMRRWSEASSLHSDWDTRTEIIASYIPSGSTVLEFGAGRLVLQHYLPDGCTYTPSDLVERIPGMMVCDLNAAQLPPFPGYDLAIFSGVIEYVHDLPRLVEHLAIYFQTVIASYAVTDFAGQDKPMLRRQHGWVNDYSSQELLDLFSFHGYRCDQKTIWRDQNVYQFVRYVG